MSEPRNHGTNPAQFLHDGFSSDIPTPVGRLPVPLRGLTVLVVEDSRLACDAMRLMLYRLGARMRRAGTLAAARGFLAVSRADVAIVDLGLPDGPGEDLVRELCAPGRGGPLVLATSGNPDGQASAMAAGAAGFLAKPILRIADLAAAIIDGRPDAERRRAVGAVAAAPLRLDPLAMRDDLAWAAARLSAGPDAGALRYLANFIGGVARQAADDALGLAALSATDNHHLHDLCAMIDDRMRRAHESAGPV